MNNTTLTPLPSPTVTPMIGSRRDFIALLENIARLQGVREELWRAQEEELAAVRLRHRASLAEVENFLHLETGWAEAWARQHPEVFGKDRTLTGTEVTAGFRPAPARVERASRRWTWSRIAATLAGLPWGPRYLRTPAAEVDKEALAADLPKFSREELRSAGMVVIDDEQFYIKPLAADSAPWAAAA